MSLSLLNHSALALFAQRTRIPTSARSIGFCAIWVCISTSTSSSSNIRTDLEAQPLPLERNVMAQLPWHCHSEMQRKSPRKFIEIYVRC
jgi:hypothetical protein